MSKNYNADSSDCTSEQRKQNLVAENKIKEKHSPSDKILLWQKCSANTMEFPRANCYEALKCLVKAESYMECVKTHFINKDYIAAVSYVKYAMIQTAKILLSLDDNLDEKIIDVMQCFERDYIQTGIICPYGFFDSEDMNRLLKKLEYYDDFETVRDEVSEAIGSLEMLFEAVNYIFAHCYEEDEEEIYYETI